jgi:hypothetical protein
MKIFTGLVTLALFTSISMVEVSGQCEPDTVNCKDTGAPGQICPRNLPDGTVNVPYDESITVLAPPNFEYQGILIDVAYIIVDSVLNLPPGIEYWASAEQFYPDSAYCIQVFGTPEEEGEFQLAIYVTPFVSYLNNIIQGDQIVNDTSVVMTVNGPSSIDPFAAEEFQVFPVFPNPFLEVAKLGFYSPSGDEVNLKVFNILGEMMHEETIEVSPGEHYFRFDGNKLQAGTYFYRITNNSQFYTGKFIKSR